MNLTYESIKKIISHLEVIADNLEEGKLIHVAGDISMTFPSTYDVLESTTLDSKIKPPKRDYIIFSSNAEFKIKR